VFKRLIEMIQTDLIGVRPNEMKKFLERPEFIGLKYEYLTLPLKCASNLYVAQVWNSHKDFEIFAGMGSGLRREAAWIRAIFEAIERLTMLEEARRRKVPWSSNGVAAHRTLPLAKRFAKIELLERDSLLRHWYLEVPFAEVSDTGFSAKVRTELQTLGLELLIKQTFLGSLETVIAFIVQKNGGFAIGLSSGRGAKGNVEKAISECLINYYFGHEGLDENQLRARLRDHGFVKYSDHRTYWLYQATLPEWVRVSGNLREARYSFSKHSPILQYDVLRRTPAFVVRVESAQVLDLPLGQATREDLRPLAEQLKSSSFEAKNLIHPLP
jgi:hypothetical protein